MFAGLKDPALWVALAFWGFVAILMIKRVPGALAGALDDRADQIRQELEEARKLRQEAQILKADYERKKHEAEAEAEEIILLAQKEAEILATETEEKLAEQLERRTRQAEDKIARAEQQAISEVQRTATALSIKAAKHLLRNGAVQSDNNSLVEEAIRTIPQNFANN